MNSLNWASNATTTCGFAVTPERLTAARELLRSGGDFFLQIGRWTRTSTKTVSPPKTRPLSRQWRGGRFLRPFWVTALALGCRRTVQGAAPRQSDNCCILRERLARGTKRLLRYGSALILTGVSA